MRGKEREVLGRDLGEGRQWDGNGRVEREISHFVSTGTI